MDRIRTVDVDVDHDSVCPDALQRRVRRPSLKAANNKTCGGSVTRTSRGGLAYQPNTIAYPDGRIIAFVGTHNGSKPNPLNGGTVEQNGTMIIDRHGSIQAGREVPHPRTYRGRAGPDGPHVPWAHSFPTACRGQVYLMRNIQGSSASGYEVWNVTNVTNPTLVGAIRNLRTTHKPWWECKTGIAYMPGSLDASLWISALAAIPVDGDRRLEGSRCANLPFARSGYQGLSRAARVRFRLPCTDRSPLSNIPMPAGDSRAPEPAATRSAIVSISRGGVGDDGVMQVLDRVKLLPPPYGAYTGDRNNPSNDELNSAPDLDHVHVARPGRPHDDAVFGIATAELSGLHRVQDSRHRSDDFGSHVEPVQGRPPHWGSIADITVENSKNAPPGTRVEQNPWQGPVMLSSMSVDPKLGERYPRGNYCKRGARFGSHAVEEKLLQPVLRQDDLHDVLHWRRAAWDIREPQAPVEVGFYVPESNANTTSDGYMTNNVEVDDRGYVYIVDRKRCWIGHPQGHR